MPEQLTHDEVNTKTDPSVAKQWDETTPMHEQFEELYGRTVPFEEVRAQQANFLLQSYR